MAKTSDTGIIRSDPATVNKLKAIREHGAQSICFLTIKEVLEKLL